MVAEICTNSKGCEDSRSCLMSENSRTRRYGNQGSHNEREEEEEDMAFCLMLVRKKIHYFPVITAVFIIASLIISYSIAVSQGHVEPDFPYISYTAIKAPERCVFAQMVNIGACMLAGNVFIRFLQIRERLSHYKCFEKEKKLNIAGLVVGWLSALGLSIVANFQTVVMRPGHYIGAGLAFFCGMAYCWMTSSMTWKLRHKMKSGIVAIAQFINSACLTVFLVSFGISKSIYKISEGQGLGTKHDSLRVVYLISTSTEWLTATAIVTFVLTFIPDFRRIKLYGPRVKVKTEFESHYENTEEINNGTAFVNGNGRVMEMT